MPLINTTNIAPINANTRQFNLVLCELHYTPIHGKTATSNQQIEGHYMLIDRFDGPSKILLDDVEDSDYEEDDENVIHINDLMQLYKNEYAAFIARRRDEKRHRLIRNYHNIIREPNYIKPEIAECIELPTGEHIVIIKTMWIKIIQRKWKKIYATRQHMIMCRSSPTSIATRQVTGKWPNHCLYLPEIKGMLSNLQL